MWNINQRIKFYSWNRQKFIYKNNTLHNFVVGFKFVLFIILNDIFQISPFQFEEILGTCSSSQFLGHKSWITIQPG